jgi:hypothetical protein
MSDDRLNRPAARARAVADAPAEELAARAEELAHSWALALLASRPLVEMAAIPLEDLARYGPAVCASLARTLSSEEELAIFDVAARERGGRARVPAAAAALSALASGWEVSAAVEQLEALRGVLWKATLEELRDPTARQVADVCDRLASVCAAALAYVLAERSETIEAAVPRPASAPPREQVLYSAPAPSPGELGAVLIDERDDAPRQARPRAAWRRDDGSSAPSPASAQQRSQERPSARGAPGRSASRTAPRPLPWDTPLQSSTVPPPGPGPDAKAGDRSDDPVMRVSRGPGTPADRRS